jgi:poly(hydroxyalkanoate) depolymerase family esterase
MRGREARLQAVVPGSAKEWPNGLIVMLHGCKQDPDDFALGTNMNAVAEAHALLVAYPAQTSSANPSSCWNWFSPMGQTRDLGEPSIVAGVTRALVMEFGVDRHRVFVAGLSAGGATAAVMAGTYPDLYAAAGVIPGLLNGPPMTSSPLFAAMRGDFGPSSTAMSASASPGSSAVGTIVFHGSADRTVAPRMRTGSSRSPGGAFRAGRRTMLVARQRPKFHPNHCAERGRHSSRGVLVDRRRGTRMVRRRPRRNVHRSARAGRVG